MRSIRTRIVFLFTGMILAIFVVLSGVAFYYLHITITAQSSESIRFLAEGRTADLNDIFSDVERAVTTMADYVYDHYDREKWQESVEGRQEFYKDFLYFSENAARITGVAHSAYFRSNAEIYGPTDGFFLTQNGEGGYISIPPTDISAYSKQDKDHVGWYYSALQEQEPFWMDPYKDGNIRVYMTSYIIPIRIENEFVGLCGMDINMATLHRVVDDVDYDEGFGFIASREGNLLYHKEYSGAVEKKDFDEKLTRLFSMFTEDFISSGEIAEYSWNGEDMLLLTNRLDNGMLFSLTVPKSSVYYLQQRMASRMCLVLVIALAAAIFLSWQLARRIVRPIRELTDTAYHISKGELNREVKYHSADEIGELADSMRRISTEMQEYISFIHAQAYTDAMTGVKNKAAYLDEVRQLERMVYEKMGDFAVLVFDINGLKLMNDTKGHEYGDLLIRDTGAALKAIYGTDKVFRMGGDEFAVILYGVSEKEIAWQFARFDERLALFNKENENYDTELSVSKGYAIYEPSLDKEYAEVFARADEDMYKSKEAYYLTHHDRRRR